MNDQSGNPHDQATEALFVALRNVEPVPGMNDRILRAIQHAEAAPRPVFGKLIAFALAATTALVITLIVTHRSATMSENVAKNSVISTAAPIPGVISTGAQRSGERGPRRASVARWGAETPPSHAAHATTISARTKMSPARHTQLAAPALSPEEQLALDEMNAPSPPAPPLPLTAQEKLLLRIATTGDNDEYALLSSDLRADYERRLQDRFPFVANFRPYSNP